MSDPCPKACVICRRCDGAATLPYTIKPANRRPFIAYAHRECFDANRLTRDPLMPVKKPRGRPRNVRIHEIMAERNCTRQTAYKYLRKEQNESHIR